MDVKTLAELLRETAEHHDRFEKTHAEHHWWDWYAPYLSARQHGGSPEEASAAADRYMEDVLHVLPDDAVQVAALSGYVYRSARRSTSSPSRRVIPRCRSIPTSDRFTFWGEPAT